MVKAERLRLKDVRENMGYADIDLKVLRSAIDAILDHLIEDLGIEKVEIEDDHDYYWHCPASEVHDMAKKPVGIDVGRLSDDIDFVKLIQRGQSADVSFNLVHVAPLLRYIAERIEK